MRQAGADSVVGELVGGRGDGYVSVGASGGVGVSATGRGREKAAHGGGRDRAGGAVEALRAEVGRLWEALRVVEGRALGFVPRAQTLARAEVLRGMLTVLDALATHPEAAPSERAQAARTRSEVRRSLDVACAEIVGWAPLSAGAVAAGGSSFRLYVVAADGRLSEGADGAFATVEDAMEAAGLPPQAWATAAGVQDYLFEEEGEGRAAPRWVIHGDGAVDEYAWVLHQRAFGDVRETEGAVRNGAE